MVTTSFPAAAAISSELPNTSLTRTSAPFVISKSTTADEDSPIAATNSAVRPCLLVVFTLAPRASSKRTLSISATDIISAVVPKAFCALTSAPASINSVIASVEPAMAACISGVLPNSPGAFASAAEPISDFRRGRSFARIAA